MENKMKGDFEKMENKMDKLESMLQKLLEKQLPN